MIKYIYLSRRPHETCVETVVCNGVAILYRGDVQFVSYAPEQTSWTVVMLSPHHTDAY